MYFFSSPFSLSLSRIQSGSRPPRLAYFFFFHGDVQFTFANKKNPAWGHPPKFSLFFFFNRKRVSDVYMLKNKAANLPAPLPGIDNCHVFSPGFGAKLCIRLFFF